MNNNNVKQIETQNKQLVHTTFLQREESTYHHSYDEELLQYEYLRDGDLRSIEESKRMFRSGITGKLSDDPLRDKKYLFVASTTLATRFAIEGGMEALSAYNMSDLYIQQADKCESIDDVNALQTQMITDFTQKMAQLHSIKQSAPMIAESLSSDIQVSKPIWNAMDYIYYHLHEKINIPDVADYVKLSPNYLNHLFKTEKGVTISAYIRSRRIEATKNMLLYSDYSESEIAAFLAFSTTSHFIKVFREEVGITPRAFQRKYFRKHSKWSSV